MVKKSTVTAEPEKSGKSPLFEMVNTTPTDFWNDSCSVEELKYAIENGTTGATTNPVIVGEVLKKEMNLWTDRINQIIKDNPEKTEVDVVWQLIEEMAVKGSELLRPVFEKNKHMKGRISIQTNPIYWRSAELMWKQAVHFNSLAPNMQVKMPVTHAGVKALEESTYNGVSINATVCFTVPQAIAVAEAVERGLKRREAEGKSIAEMSPVCTIMVGRTDDWLKVVMEKQNILIDPGYLEWIGIATMKKTYRIYKERKYRTRLLAAAYRNYMQWTEFVGADMVLTIPFKWQKRFNAYKGSVQNRIDIPVDAKILSEVEAKFGDEFKKVYYEDGMKPADFDNHGAVRRTLISFIAGYDKLLQLVRERMIPDPDK